MEDDAVADPQLVDEALERAELVASPTSSTITSSSRRAAARNRSSMRFSLVRRPTNTMRFSVRGVRSAVYCAMSMPQLIGSTPASPIVSSRKSAAFRVGVVTAQ